MARERSATWSAGLKLAALTILILGLGLSLLAWQHTAGRLAEESNRQLEAESLAAAQRLGDRIQHSLDLLLSIQGLFRASEHVSRVEFHEHTRTLGMHERFPGLLAVQFAQALPGTQREAFEAAVRQDRSLDAAGYPQFRIHPAGERSLHVVTLFNEPMAGNEPAFGYDQYAEPTRRAALEHARDTGLPTATAPIRLLQGGTGFIIRVPVYRPGVAVDTPTARRAAYLGQISGVFRAGDLLLHVFDSGLLGTYRLTLDDIGPGDWQLGQPPAAPAELFDSLATAPGAAAVTQTSTAADAAPAADTRVHVLDVAGRMWRLQVQRPTTNWLLAPTSLAVLGGGLSTSLAIAATLLGLSRIQRRAEELAQRMSQAAMDSEARLKAVIDHAVEGIFTLDEAGMILSANPAACRVFGYELSGLVDRHIADLLPRLPVSPRPSSEDAHPGLRMLVGIGFETEGRRADAQALVMDVSVGEMQIDGQRRFVLTARDQTERRNSLAVIEATRRQLLEVDEMRRVIVQCAPYAIFVLRHDGLVLSMNPAAEQLTGWRAEDVVGKLTPEVFLDAEELATRGAQVSARLGRPLQSLDLLRHHAADIGISTSEWTLHPKGDEDLRLIVEVNTNALHDDDGHPVRYLVMAHDVTDRRRAEDKLQHMALHDALTGLPNRNMLQGHLKAVLARAVREQQPAALMFIDLDRFKKINDSLGHHVGDGVLVQVAARLRGAVRSSDIVARLGGDEFVVLCPVINAPGDVQTVTDKLMAQFREPLQVGRHELRVTPSIGVALCPEHGSDVSTLMRHADQAMYRAKQAGRNAVQVFSAELDHSTAETLQLENDLYHALGRGELLLHFQPQFDCATARLAGAEALLRWRRDGRLVSPAEFIPIAEETGLIIEIGEWVLRQACRVAARWQAEGAPGLRMAVNLSAKQLDHPHIVEQVGDALAVTGLPPGCLELEITESVIVRESLRAAQTLDRLRALGLRIAIDDFGVGYSSFAYLRELPVDRFKIDRSFLSALPQSAGDSRLTAALIAMAHRLEVGVVAEGVETEEQLRFLRDHGCDEVQGFLLGRPMPEEAFFDLLRAQPAVVAAQPTLAWSAQ